MGNTERGEYWRTLTEAGRQPEGRFAQYSEDTLRRMVEGLEQERATPAPSLPPVELPPSTQPPARPTAPRAPVAHRDPNEFAGQRLNTHDLDRPLRTDPETGFVWYQEEVLKPGAAKPRGRRVYDYLDTGTEERTMREDGEGSFTETFEVPGKRTRAAQAKITLPSYQVGIYQDPRFEQFRIVTYAGRRAFLREDVNKFYGGQDLVPSTVKKVYVSNVLAYDIRSVIRAVEDEARRLQMQAGHR